MTKSNKPAVDFLALDKLPNRLILELSSKTLGPYTVQLRSKYKKAINELRQQIEKTTRTELALQKARNACKKMAAASASQTNATSNRSDSAG